MSRYRIQALLTCVASLAASAHAGEPPGGADELEEITVTATRSAAPVLAVPATVSVFTAARMEKQLVETIEDLVRYEPGVTVRTSPARFTAAGASTGRDGQSGFNIRGLEGNRVLIQVDGVRTPDAFSYGGQSVGRGEYVDLGLLKSVEILRGPASALYGSDGVAGAVSFTTRDPADLLAPGGAFTARLHSSWASLAESTANSLLTAGRLGEWEVLAAYTRRDGEAQKTGGSNDAANTDRTTANPEDNETNSALVKLVRPLGDRNRLRLTWDHLDSRTDWDVLSAIAKPPTAGPLPGTAVIRLAAFDTVQRNRYALDHRYEDAGSGWLESLSTTLSWQSSRTRQFSAEDRNTAADRIRDAYYDNLVRSLNVEGHGRFEGAIEQHLVFGLDASRTNQKGVRDGTVPPFGESFPSHAFPTTDYTLVGVFVQDELRWDKVSLYPALRWDHFKLDPQDDPLFTAATPAELSDSRVSPKLGVVWRFAEQWNAFGNLASGYKAPAPGQVNNGFSNPSSFYMAISNPDLKPETSRTVEAGLRYQGKRWSAALTGFTGRYKDFIEMVQVDGSFTAADPAVYQYVNLSGVEISGVEFKSVLPLTDALSWTLTGAYSRGDYDDAGEKTPLESIDPLRVVTGLDWNPHGLPFGGQAVATFVTRKADSRTGMACTGGCYVPGGYGLVDLIAWWQPQSIQGLSLRAGVFNALDKHYANWSDIRGVSQTAVNRDAYFNAGRNFSASLTLQF